MISTDDLRATLADRERHAPDTAAVRRRIAESRPSGRRAPRRSDRRRSGRGSLLLAVAAVAAIAVLTSVVVIGARDGAPAAPLALEAPDRPAPAPADTAVSTPSRPPLSVLAATGTTGSVATAYAGTATPPAQPTGASNGPLPDSVETAAWNTAGDRLLVTTFGSSGCPHRIASVVLSGPQLLKLTTDNGADDGVGRSCSADLAPFITEIIVPDGIIPTERLTVVLDRRSLVVAPISADGPVTRAFRPAEVFSRVGPAPVTHDDSYRTFLAQWAGDGRLFITTAGSSSIGCERSIVSVTLTGPQTISIGTGNVRNGTAIPTTVMLSCNGDLSPLVSEIVLPPGIVSTAALTIVLDGMSLELPPES